MLPNVSLHASPCLPMLAGYVWQTAENEWGHAVVATALSVVDDTALTGKTLLPELKVCADAAAAVTLVTLLKYHTWPWQHIMVGNLKVLWMFYVGYDAALMWLVDDILTTGGLKTQCRVSSAPCEHR
jgi:hypothetical protein